MDAAQIVREHEPRPFGCACGARIGDDIDRRWHLVNVTLESVDREIEVLTTERDNALLRVEELESEHAADIEYWKNYQPWSDPNE